MNHLHDFAAGFLQRKKSLIRAVVCLLVASCVIPIVTETAKAQTSSAGQALGSVDIRVDRSADDAEERIFDGLMYLNSSDLELINDVGDKGPQIVGVRFRNVTVPEGAHIQRAYLEFNVHHPDDDPTTLYIFGESTGSANGFSSTAADISERPTTQARANWYSLPPWTEIDTAQQTPDLSQIVQEIVDRDDWLPGNSMAFIIMGTGQRTASAFDSRPDSAPRLVIEYASADVPPRPKNIILMIGDGMGFEHVKATSYFATGKAEKLSFESAPYQAQMTTYAANRLVTDSAASATAMATGHKVNNRVISMAYPGDGSPLETLIEYFDARCKSSGMVVNGYVDEATPAAFGAHEISRYKHLEILQDYFTETRPTVLLGDYAGSISDDLILGADYTIVEDRNELEALDPLAVNRVFGRFKGIAAAYAYDYEIGAHDVYKTQPHLAEMTEHTLEILSRNYDGFFLMVEGSRIDHVATRDDPDRLPRTVYEILEFTDAVDVALSWAATHGDTLVIVTADHETGGLWVQKNNGKGQMPLVHWELEDHTAVNVPVYAWGPNAEQVTGIIDNTDIYRIATINSSPAGQKCVGTIREQLYLPSVQQK